MSNNGLLCSNDVCATAMPSSAYFIRKGEAIVVPSPLQIISPDLSEVTTISTGNNGDSAIDTTAALFVNLGTDNDLFLNTAPTGAGDTHGIILSRNGLIPASIKLPASGKLRFQNTTGAIELLSIDGTKTVSIVEDNSGDCSIIPTLGNILLNVGEDKNVYINTDPATGSDKDGIIITRPDAVVPCSMTLPLGGQLEVETFTGAIDIKSSQGAYKAFLGVDPFTGVVTLANPNTGADGDVRLSCASAVSSLVDILVQPTVGSSGIKITNALSPSNPCVLNVSSVGDLEIASNTLVSVGDNTVIGGAIVNVNGTLGASRVYDVLYNRPGINLIASYATTFASSTSLTTFTVPRNGRYMIEMILNYAAATIGSPGAASGYLKYGDPAHAAVDVPGTENTATEYMLAPTVGGFNVLTIQRFFTLSTNVFEPNQRYAFANLGQSVSGGVLDMSIYEVN
jgi:hypothetical protein